MDHKRILLIKSGRFIGGVIHSLFERNEKLTVIEAEPQDGQALMNTVRIVQPEVVVLDDTLAFEYLPELLDYLCKIDNFRIVVVNANANQVQLYQKQNIQVLQSQDFFAIVE